MLARSLHSALNPFYSLDSIVKTNPQEIDEKVSNKHPHPDFLPFIVSILKSAHLQTHQIEYLTSQNNLHFWVTAFTSPTYHEDNYEFFELLGDSVLNHCVVMILKNRFPDLCNPKGVKYLARLKIEHVSKQKFSLYAKKLGFEKFVLCDETEHMDGKVKRSVLEDCFEAFAGCLATLCDEMEACSGYKYCYNLIESILSKERITLDYEVLFDAKSRLKEYIDQLRNHELTYDTVVIRDPVKDEVWYETRVVIKYPNGDLHKLSSAKERTKKSSSQLAAKQAIEELKRENKYVNTFNDVLHVCKPVESNKM